MGGLRLGVLGMDSGQGWCRNSGHAEFSSRMSRLWLAVPRGFVGPFLLAGVVVGRDRGDFTCRGGHR